MYYHDGSRYEGDFRNDDAEGKGIKYLNNVIDMKEIFEIIYQKEKEFIIIIIVIEKWVISLMICQKEN